MAASPEARGPIVADAVVVAAGRSRRMNGADKVQASLAGRPLLAWTLDAIAAAPEVERIVVVVDPGRASEPRPAWYPEKVVATVAGGAERQHSVAAGVRVLTGMSSQEGPHAGERIVLVHDGARPLVTPGLVSAVAAAAVTHGAALPVLEITDTIKRLDGARVGATVDRAGLAVAQTPQGIRLELLQRAYATYPPEASPTFTDEASLLEACAIPVHVVPGEVANFKITLPADLTRAEELLAAGLVSRVGIGSDSHPFGPGEPLRLGGIEIAGAPRLHGHSDGDVALHAIADALLGAAALGDLGRLFPADRRTPRGIASSDLLAEVVGRLGAAGWRPASLDVTIVGARPRLAAVLPAMVAAIATLAGLEEPAVSVKASSGNLSGDEGAGRVISARAVAMISAGSKPR